MKYTKPQGTHLDPFLKQNHLSM